jgi:hypothetical protein
VLEFGLFDAACEIFNRCSEGQFDLLRAHAPLGWPLTVDMTPALRRDVRSIDRLQIRELLGYPFGPPDKAILTHCRR